MKQLISIILVGLFMSSCVISIDEDIDDVSDSISEAIDENIEEIIEDLDLSKLEIRMEEMCLTDTNTESEIIHEIKVIDKNGAKAVHASLEVLASNIKLSGGTKHLMMAGFVYNEPEWQPEITYNVSNRKGYLKLIQPETNNMNIDDDTKYLWNIRLNEEIPLELDVFVGAGKAELLLGDLNLSSLKMKMGIGLSELDFRGDWTNSSDIHIKGGIGQITIIIPQNVGVHISIEQAFGSVDTEGLIKLSKNEYVNEAFEKSDITLNYTIESGLGAIEIKEE